MINANTYQDQQDWTFPVKFLIGLGSDDLVRIASRVASIYEIEVDDISLKGKQQKRIKSVETCANLCPIHEAKSAKSSLAKTIISY